MSSNEDLKRKLDLIEEPFDSDEDKKTANGRRKIKIEYIEDKSRRHITFSKRKAGIMKKAYELSTLTGTQVLLLVASETGHVYTFATPKLQPLITKPEGKTLIQQCLNTPDQPPQQQFGSLPQEVAAADPLSQGYLNSLAASSNYPYSPAITANQYVYANYQQQLQQHQQQPYGGLVGANVAAAAAAAAVAANSSHQSQNTASSAPFALNSKDSSPLDDSPHQPQQMHPSIQTLP